MPSTRATIRKTTACVRVRNPIPVVMASVPLAKWPGRQAYKPVRHSRRVCCKWFTLLPIVFLILVFIVRSCALIPLQRFTTWGSICVFMKNVHRTWLSQISSFGILLNLCCRDWYSSRLMTSERIFRLV